MFEFEILLGRVIVIDGSVIYSVHRCEVNRFPFVSGFSRAQEIIFSNQIGIIFVALVVIFQASPHASKYVNICPPEIHLKVLKNL